MKLQLQKNIITVLFKKIIVTPFSDISRENWLSPAGRIGSLFAGRIGSLRRENWLSRL
jgi:hypothetical protein